jgi:hypothetical protein
MCSVYSGGEDERDESFNIKPTETQLQPECGEFPF